jgi:hypothetical protein
MLDEEERIPLQPPRAKSLGPHPGIPWAMFGARQVARLWSDFRITTYTARKVGLTPSQAVAVLADLPHRAMKEADARSSVDRLIAKWRRERCR